MITSKKVARTKMDSKRNEINGPGEIDLEQKRLREEKDKYEAGSD